MPRWILRLTVVAPAAIGLTVLLGWALDVEALRHVIPLDDQPQVKANTALFLVALATGLGLLLGHPVSPVRRRASRGLAILACAVGGLTLAEHVLGIDAGIDQLLVREEPGTTRTPHPGRMAVNTALVMMLLGAALLTFEMRRRRLRLANALAGVAGLIALLALTGILLSADVVPVFSQYARMGVATAIAILFLAAGITLSRSDTTTVRLVTGIGPASQAARRLLPLVLLISPVLAYLRLEGERQGLYNLELGTWLLSVSLSAILGGACWALVRRLDRAELQSQAADHATREARAAAERANLAKSEFLSRMSHELRTPLNAILGFGQLLEMDDLDDEQRESVEHILHGGRHLLELIDEILDISRIEAGTMRMSVEPVDVLSALGDAVALIGPVAHQAGIGLSLERGDGDECYVMADRQRLRQVFLNLLSNAVKYNRPGGTVTVSITRDAEQVRIDVADTGRGIAAEHLDRLFVAFDRLGAEGGEVEGTGLGLTLSRNLAEQMGGALSAQSTAGEGSVFTLALCAAASPIDETSFVEARSAGRAARALGPRRILQIEDNPANIKLIAQTFASQPDVQLVAVVQGRRGLELAKADPPDLILLDLHLPDMHGSAVLERLRSDPDTADVPVIVLSADATARQIRELLEAGAREYLTKPLDVREFLLAVDRHLPGAPAALESPTE